MQLRTSVYYTNGPVDKIKPEWDRNGESKSESSDNGECDDASCTVVLIWIKVPDTF